MNIYVREDGTLAVRPVNGGAYRASGSPDSIPMYGEGGLFAVSGMHPQVVSAIVNPIGVERILQWVGNTEMNPIYDALVDIQSSTTAQSSGCADCGKPSFKEAPLTSRFGRYCQQTQEQQFDQIGRRMNRGVPQVAMFGNITDPAGNVLIGQGQQITDNFVLNLIGVAYNLRRIIGEEIWSGDGTATGGLVHMNGLDLLVNTGQREAFNNTLVPALDSQLIDYGSNIVGATGSPSIRAYIRAVILSIRYRISAMGYNPDSAVMQVTMPPRHWEAVAHAIACEYGATCNVGPTTEQDAREVERYRERIMAESVIPIDGRNYPVVLDNQMTTTTGYYGDQTKFCSDIFVLTTSVAGKTILWGEYQDFNESGGRALAMLREMFGSVPLKITDGGRFVHAPTFEGGFCFDVRTLTCPRIVLTMPQLQGRVQNVCVTSLASYPDVTGSDGLYTFDDGLTEKPYLGLYDQGYDNRQPEQL